ncbi:MAG: M20/M25/M40 family metallo-hydrolase [Clostridia bacterium]|nr:M20/M25/M40 family metallo-hydrolase [Clostridia bacterium]
MLQNLVTFIQENMSALRATLKELCLIPAPSLFEDVRAAYCKAWLEGIGAKGVYIDEAKNVIYPHNCEGSSAITVVVAHTDTVFPDREPMPYREENGRIYCPGVGDDTASLVVMMYAVKYMLENDIRPAGGILFVANSCEEGLGNLLGTRTVMQAYKGRVRQFVSLDSHILQIADTCVGSHRYEVETLTEGGHSYLDFGNRSAMLSLAEMISAIYAIPIPQKEGKKTTVNVGIVESGTSVNTIPQSAKMLCEYRSDDVEALTYMEGQFARIFAEADCEHTRVRVTRVGDRPCAGKVNVAELDRLRNTCRTLIEEITGGSVEFESSSTDCNIPLSLGIPAICIGVYDGGGTHTREEYIEAASLPTGLAIAVKALCKLTEV